MRALCQRPFSSLLLGCLESQNIDEWVEHEFHFSFKVWWVECSLLREQLEGEQRIFIWERRKKVGNKICMKEPKTFFFFFGRIDKIAMLSLLRLKLRARLCCWANKTHSPAINVSPHLISNASFSLAREGLKNLRDTSTPKWNKQRRRRWQRRHNSIDWNMLLSAREKQRWSPESSRSAVCTISYLYEATLMVSVDEY